MQIIFEGEGRAGAPSGVYDLDLEKGRVKDCPVPLEERRNCGVMTYGCCAAMSEDGVEIVPPDKTIGFVCSAFSEAETNWELFINPSKANGIDLFK